MKYLCRYLFLVSLSICVIVALIAVIASSLGYEEFVTQFAGPSFLGMIGIAFVSMGLCVDVWHTPWKQITRADNIALFWIMSSLPLTLGIGSITVSIYLFI